MSSILFDQQSETTAPPKVLNRRWIAWLAGGLLIAIVIALVAWRLTQALAKPEAPPSAIPTVSVAQIGISTVPSTVSIIGTIAARYDMPIGVEGDGGRVTAVYVEAGDHVKQGQVLAHLNNSVLEPQVTNLEAALDQARAEADLAQAEYQRAQAVGASGALSAEETQKRKSSAITAATHVKVAAAQLAWPEPMSAHRPTASFSLATLKWGRRPWPAGKRCFACPRMARRSCAAKWRSRTCRCSRWDSSST
jgi:hypothetical protein